MERGRGEREGRGETERERGRRRWVNMCENDTDHKKLNKKLQEPKIIVLYASRGVTIIFPPT